VTRKRRLSILRSEIFHRPGARAQDRLLFCFLPYCLFHTNCQSLPKRDQHKRKINTDTLQDVFELIFAPLQGVAPSCVPIDCANGKVRLFFPILSAWMADHMENVALHGLKSNACAKCEVPTHELQTNAKNYETRDNSGCQRYKPEIQNAGLESDDDHVMCDYLGIGQNIFHRLDRVSASDLYKPDMLYIIYPGLFKPMMDWIEGFLKKHGRLLAFDDVWAALPPYPGFLVPKKAYPQVT